jgi:hypothetical protein
MNVAGPVSMNVAGPVSVNVEANAGPVSVNAEGGHVCVLVVPAMAGSVRYLSHGKHFMSSTEV